LCEISKQTWISLNTSSQFFNSCNVSLLPSCFAAYRGARNNREYVVKATASGNAQAAKLISSTEVPAFIQRDDMMDQVSWEILRAAFACKWIIKEGWTSVPCSCINGLWLRPGKEASGKIYTFSNKAILRTAFHTVMSITAMF
jgi:hypothetical protein